MDFSCWEAFNAKANEALSNQIYLKGVPSTAENLEVISKVFQARPSYEQAESSRKDNRLKNVITCSRIMDWNKIKQSIKVIFTLIAL